MASATRPGPAMASEAMPKRQQPGRRQEFPLMSRREMEAMIADGRHLVIVDQHVLKCDAWLKFHPGGDIAIKHMVGRDATDEVNALHSPEARALMLRYRIGRIEGRWTNFVPPIQGGEFKQMSEDEEPSAVNSSALDGDSDSSSAGSSSPPPVFDSMSSGLKTRHGATSTSSVSSESLDPSDMDGMTYLDSITREKISLDLDSYPPVDEITQANITAKYRELHEKIKESGLYECRYSAYAIECCRYVSLFALSMTFLSYGYVFLGALALGFMWHQLVFTAHDAGHMGITHNFQIDSTIGIVIADFIGGLSMGWWKYNHNVHHIVTNAPEHDPDIEHMPIFAISHRLLGNLRSTFYNKVMAYDAAARVLLQVQAWTYYPLLAFARFNLTLLSWEFLFSRRGPKKGPAAWQWYLEVVGQLFFLSWYGYGVVYRMVPDAWSRFVFVMVSNIAASPVHLQIVLSHFAMSTADLGPQESFAQKMLRTTMDVDCPEWLDFIHGGLQFQAIHHLYPRIPRHNLRRTQRFVQEFCNEVDIPYALYGFTDGNKEVIGRLGEVSRQAAILEKCRQSVTESGGVFGHHH